MVEMEVKVVFCLKKNFYPPAIFYEGDIHIIIKEIAGKAVRGRSIYGFFLLEKEFNRLFPKVHSDYRVMPFSESKGEIFKRGSDVYMEELLQMYEIPIRKIRFWHRLGWKTFAE